MGDKVSFIAQYKKKIAISLIIIFAIMIMTNPGKLPIDGGEIETMSRNTGQQISSYYNLLLFSIGRQFTMNDNSGFENGEYKPKYISFSIKYVGLFHNYFMLVRNNDTNSTNFEIMSK
jgi:hypothetical protein